MATFRSASGANGSGTTVTLTCPTGTVSGDIMLAALSADGTRTFTPPAGWTALASNPRNTTGDIQTCAVYTRTADGSDTAGTTTYVFTVATASSCGVIAAWGDCSLSIETSKATAGGAGSPITITADSPGSASGAGVALWIAMIDASSGGAHAYTPPSGYTSRITQNNGGNFASANISDSTISAGTVAAASGSATFTGTSGYYAAHVVLLDAGGGGGAVPRLLLLGVG